ncbi:hypothetical protein H2198_007682 [Neophaeococcomyces mojaviensis]|uniref:Uncharacterized protein n=1 Tax=Neophaeococcomyces mojaviensis TaxID=3383035 RepID=A0ACC3A008_9EURO|nr:hypothetical protein H2198_007682 [Knufia sp. JES_112]
MTSLIFWVPYLAHKGVVDHRREKQRIKNYERWEGLRDEYDEQRRTTRSLDIQRTGQWDPTTNTFSDNAPADTGSGYGRRSMDQDQGIFTLRDQQEANDARTGWRPQEAWDSPRTQLQAQMTGQVQQVPMSPHHPTAQRHVSAAPSPAYMQPQVPQQTSISSLPLKAQKTGATWDEGIPAPLQVSRRSFDDYDYARYRHASATGTPMPGSRDASATRQGRDQRGSLSNAVSRTHTPSGLRMESTQQQAQVQNMPDFAGYRAPEMPATQTIELPKNDFGFVEPAMATGAVPGGRIAELIERGY